MRRRSAKLTALYPNLRYWQTRARIAERDLRGCREKVKEIAAEMRKEQARLK